MNPALVADVGNTRIKWGRCSPAGVVETASLPFDDRPAWQRQLELWKLAPPLPWAIGGVHPPRLERLADWLRQQGAEVLVLDCWQQLPLKVLVERPEQVGLDRLFNAVAVKSRVQFGTAALIIDAGTAITVNRVDGTGAFRGGAILPGLGLMARALHDYTALLPSIELPVGIPTVPATSTVTSLQAGVFWAAAGGIRALIEQLNGVCPGGPAHEVFITGGDAGLLAPAVGPACKHWPQMTLEGIRLAAEALP